MTKDQLNIYCFICPWEQGSQLSPLLPMGTRWRWASITRQFLQEYSFGQWRSFEQKKCIQISVKECPLAVDLQV